MMVEKIKKKRERYASFSWWKSRAAAKLAWLRLKYTDPDRAMIVEEAALRLRTVRLSELTYFISFLWREQNVIPDLVELAPSPLEIDEWFRRDKFTGWKNKTLVKLIELKQNYDNDPEAVEAVRKLFKRAARARRKDIHGFIILARRLASKIPEAVELVPTPDQIEAWRATANLQP